MKYISAIKVKKATVTGADLNCYPAFLRFPKKSKATQSRLGCFHIPTLLFIFGD
jgi:hypothetical protein